MLAPDKLKDVQPQLNINAAALFRHVPAFYTSNPEVWFATVESQFQLHRITLDVTKYNLVVTKLNEDSLTLVEDIVINPPSQDKYNKIKNRLQRRYGISKEQRFQKPISGLQLGDKRPSFLWAEMESVNKAQLDEASVRTLWIDLLPKQIQVTLATAIALDTEAIAELADRVWEVQDRREHSLMAVNITNGASEIVVNTPLEQKVNELNKQLQQLEI